jgi:hypothetical protein
MAYQVGRFEAPSDIWVANIDGKGERQLTHVHDAFMSEVALSQLSDSITRARTGRRSKGGCSTRTGIRRTRAVSDDRRDHGGPHSADGTDSISRISISRRTATSCSRSTSELDGLRREVLVGDVGRVGHEGRTGRDVGRRLRDRPLSRRPREGGGDRAFVWRVHDELADHAVSRPIRGAASGAGIANWTSDYANSDIPRTKETEFWGRLDPKARETMIRSRRSRMRIAFARRRCSSMARSTSACRSRRTSSSTSRSRSRACRRR